MKSFIFGAESKVTRKLCAVALALFCAAAAGRTLFAEDSRREPMKIRVGYFAFDGYHQIAEDGSKSGYGYDFLQMIAPYANFEYEYVGYEKSWGEMQKMLENGEIDLLTSAQKNPQREEIFDYSDRNIGFSSTIITANPANTAVTTADFSTFENVRVGMIHNNSRNASFANYAQKHGFGYVPVYFENQIIMAQAMKDGEIDVMVTSDLRTLDNEIILAKFDDSPFFAIVKKGNSAVMDRVNNAIEMLSMDVPSWMPTLSYRYYNTVYHGNEIVLLPEEEALLASTRGGAPLKVLLNPDRAPYTYLEHGNPKGIFVDLLESIAGKIGLEYEIVACKTVKEYENAIRAHKASLVFGSVMDSYTAEMMGYHMTNTFHVTSLACVTRVNETEELSRVAVNDGMEDLNKRYTALYGGRERVECQTVRECMEAVKSRKADCCYVYTYTASKYVFEDVRGALAYTPVSNTLTNVGIAVRGSDGPVLFHLMNRIAGNLTEDDLQSIIANNTRFSYAGRNLLAYFVYKHPVAFVLTVALVISALSAAVVVKRGREKKLALLLLEEDEKKRDALELACAAAERANKAKSDFLSKMSHDIRTPMNAIVGMTAIAQTHVDEPARVSECLSKITSSSQHLLALINEVLDMSKIESGTFSLSYGEFDIQKLVGETVEIVMPDAKAHKHRLCVNAEGIVHKDVVGDALRIQQVFVNIAGNAIKYTPNGGEIEISVRELESNQPKIGAYEFVFKDNGIGMSREFLKTVFDPFSREKDSRVDQIQGTGLGLAITKNIIEMMDGTINVQSERNVGTTFTVVLKLKQQDAEVSGASAEGAEKGLPLEDFSSFDFSGKRVLLVDDNFTNREIAREILEMTKIAVDEAEDGKAAVEKFAASREGCYSLVFMDVQMPVMNGYDASVAIRMLSRNDAKSVPIIAMTADAFAEDIEKATRSGMNEHLAKPLDMKKLAEVMRRWLGN